VAIDPACPSAVEEEEDEGGEGGIRRLILSMQKKKNKKTLLVKMSPVTKVVENDGKDKRKCSRCSC